MTRRKPSRKRLGALIVGGLLSVVVAVSVATYAYIHVFEGEAPPPPGFDTLDAAAAAETTLSTDLNAACQTMAFESGVTVTVQLPVNGTLLSGTTPGASGELRVCGDVATSGTLDVDVASLAQQDGATTEDVTALRAALKADEFPVLSVTVGQPSTATIGEAEPVQVDVDVVSSGQQVSAVTLRFAS